MDENLSVTKQHFELQVCIIHIFLPIFEKHFSNASFFIEGAKKQENITIHF